MGTTLTALNAGSIDFKWIVAIEGYKFLLTDATAAQATTAWNGTDWASALTGLFVRLDNQGSIDPWDPFKPGGRCTLYMLPEATDQFGIDTHRKAAGAETYLAATCDRDDTTITVVDTSTFAAATNEAYIGNECFEYSAKTSTTFTASKRGKYSPFAAGGTGSPRFSGTHRVTYDANQVMLDPVVSQQPRSWLGRWVGVWMHRVTSGTLDVQAQAQLVFAGRIVEIRDDPQTGCTVVELEHALDYVQRAIVGRNLYNATLQDGVYLPSGNSTFKFNDRNQAGVGRTANSLTLTPGTYTLDMLCSQLNQWLATEFAAARSWTTLKFTSPFNVPGGGGLLRTKYTYRQATAASPTVFPLWTLTMPAVAAFLLGLRDFVGLTAPGEASIHSDPFDPAVDYTIFSNFPPMRFILFRSIGGAASALQCTVDAGSGTFFDQYASMPASLKPATSGGLTWGLFLLDDRMLIRASFDGTVLSNILPAFYRIIDQPAPGDYDAATYNKAADDLSVVHVRQICILERTPKTFLRELFYSTGTAGYNKATYDDLPYELAIGIPGGLLGTAFDNSCDALAGGDATLAIVIDKPTKLGDLIGSDLILRRASLIWKQGGLRFVTFSTPTTNAAIATLGESTKANPATSSDASGQRTAPVETNQWQKVYVKIAYNRAANNLTKDGGYQSFLSLEDGVAADDAGGAGDVFTLNARNTYAQDYQTGAGIEQLVPFFLATQPLFSRTALLLTRSIDQRFYEQLAPGDIVTINDNFARDPATGLRKMAAVPGVISRIRYSPGGPMPTSAKPAAQVGEIDVFMLALNRVAAYCPSAQVDDTQNASGFSAGYNSASHVLRCYAHQHSESSEPADASFFNVGDVLRVVEIDPANTASPTTWTGVIVQAVSGNDITLTAALTSPAWDAAKKYRIISDHYTAAQASQQANTYQASSTSYQVDSTRQPYQLGTGSGQGTTFTAWAPGELAELPADVEAGDGKARDTGTERGNIRLVNAIHDYRTARCSPALSPSVCTNTTYSTGAGYQAVMYAPMFLCSDIIIGVSRNLIVAPFFRSGTGASVTIRVSVMRYPLGTDTSFNDVNRGPVYAEAAWTTTSTTWAVGAPANLPIATLKDANGLAWLLIEATIHGETRGLAECIEDYRVSS